MEIECYSYLLSVSVSPREDQVVDVEVNVAASASVRGSSRAWSFFLSPSHAIRLFSNTWRSKVDRLSKEKMTKYPRREAKKAE